MAISPSTHSGRWDPKGPESAEGQGMCNAFLPFPTCLMLLYPHVKQPSQSAIPVPQSWEDVLSDRIMGGCGGCWLQEQGG